MSALTDIFDAIADAIRSKNGSSDTYTPAQMASAIEAIPSGGSETTLWEETGTPAGFSTKTIDLNQAANNFNKIKVYYKANTGSAWEAYTFSVIYDLTENSNYFDGLNVQPGFPRMTIGYKGCQTQSASNKMVYVRDFWFTDNTYTSIYFSTCYNLGYTSAASLSCLPIKITGIN